MQTTEVAVISHLAALYVQMLLLSVIHDHKSSTDQISATRAGFGVKMAVKLHIGGEFKVQHPNCQLSTANYQLSTAILAKSQQPNHLGGWFWCQNDCLITY